MVLPITLVPITTPPRMSSSKLSDDVSDGFLGGLPLFFPWLAGLWKIVLLCPGLETELATGDGDSWVSWEDAAILMMGGGGAQGREESASEWTLGVGVFLGILNPSLS